MRHPDCPECGYEFLDKEISEFPIIGDCDKRLACPECKIELNIEADFIPIYKITAPIDEE